MSILHSILPFEKVHLESNLPQTEIMSRMNWFLNTAMRGGELNGVHIRGYVQEKSFFFEIFPSTGKKGANQYAGTVEGSSIWFFVRMQKNVKTVLLVFTALAVLSATIVPFMEPDGIEKVGPVCGGMGVFYLLILVGLKVEARRVKRYIFQMLEVQ